MRVSRIHTRRQSRIGALISSVTPAFARTGDAYLDGVSYPANTPRYPSQSGVMGVLVEESGTNLLTYSDGTTANLSNASNVTDAPGAIAGYTNAIAFGNNSVLRLAYKNNAVIAAATTYTLTVIVTMDDGGVPSPGTSASNDFNLVIGNSGVSSFMVTAIGGGRYRVTGTLTTGTPAGNNTGVSKLTGFSARGFKVTGFDLKAKAYGTSPITTTSAAVTQNAETLTIPTAGLLVPSQGSVIIRPCLAGEVAKAAGLRTRDYALFDTRSAPNRLLAILKADGNLNLTTVSAAGTFSTATKAMPLTNAWPYLVFRFSPAFIDIWAGGTGGSKVNTPNYPSALGSLLYLLSDSTGGIQWNQPGAEVLLYTHVLTDAEAAAANAGNLPPDFTAYLDFTAGKLEAKQGHPWQTAEMLNTFMDRR